MGTWRFGGYAVLFCALAACGVPNRTDAGDVATDPIGTDTQRQDGPADGTPDASPLDVPTDAPHDAGPCRTDGDCSDMVFCNGIERCTPGATGADARGCVPANPATPCMPTQTCNEAMARCGSVCDLMADADGDGHNAITCGGDDCDDADRNRFPGNPEVCDPADHDEDCDAATHGARDIDRDGFDDARCCNVSAAGVRTCGDDCNDVQRSVNPTTSEVCDLLDNNCNGMVDEGVTQPFYEDHDGDLHGDPARRVMACGITAGLATLGDDCDDANAAIQPAQIELCDGIDNNCNGTVDEDARPVTWYRDTDGDGFGTSASGTQVSCTPPTGYSLLGTDCDDTRASVNPRAMELCDGRDNNCNGLADAVVSPGNLEDDDGDGVADAMCMPAGGDCDDLNAAVRGTGTPELCDGYDNDCDGMVDESAAASMWYVDADMDGYGDSTAAAMMSCMPIAGRVTVGGDCDDANPARRPGLPDRCDTVDNDCDGTVDEDQPPSIWYPDADHDGAGADTPTTAACTMPAGMVAAPGDCNDTSAAIHPGATERCNNVDDNCDGTVDGTAAAPDCSLRNATATCTAGACVVVSCTAPFGNCDGDSANGCETNTDDTFAHCGSCTTTCTGTDRCRTGVCVPPSSVSSYDVGNTFACAVRSDGSVECWGLGQDGRLGDGTTQDRGRPTLVPGVTDAVQVSTGSNIAGGVTHACLRRRSGAVACWGSNSQGQLGDGTITSRMVPTDVPGLTDAVDITTGTAFSCAVRTGGTVVCWGDNGYGMLGDGTTTDRRSPGTIPSLVGVTTVRSGDYHSCALLADRTVWCWGYNANYQLGDNTTTMRTTPVTVTGLTDIVEIAAGGSTSCARNSTGAVYCWGYNNYGQVGIGTTVAARVPTALPMMTDAAHITVGTSHTCAVRASGAVACWGYNLRGQLGDGTTTNRSSPTAVAITNAADINAGLANTCALLTTGAMQCWGDNLSGQLGNATLVDALAPTPVLGVTGANGIGAGIGHTCASFAATPPMCWGSNSNGQLGRPLTVTMSSTAAAITLAGGATEIDLGENFALVRQASGSLFGWGRNAAGQLGNGSTTDAATAVGVSGVLDAVTVAGGQIFTCAIRTGGAVWCWGSNLYGQLGTGNTTNATTPRACLAPAAAGMNAVAAGWHHACARGADGSLVCWGRNTNSQLGDGLVVQRNTPYTVAGVTGVLSVGAGAAHTCVGLMDGTVSCWGLNTLGQLGDGTILPRTTRAVVTGLSNAVQVVSGDDFNCARLSTGGVSCWGSNSDGQLGDGTHTDSSAPIPVAGITDAVQVTAGVAHACARRTSGEILCWGRNQSGQTGDGRLFLSSTPVNVAGFP